MGFFVLLILVIVIVAIVSVSGSGKGSAVGSEKKFGEKQKSSEKTSEKILSMLSVQHFIPCTVP